MVGEERKGERGKEKGSGRIWGIGRRGGGVRCHEGEFFIDAPGNDARVDDEAGYDLFDSRGEYCGRYPLKRGEGGLKWRLVNDVHYLGCAGRHRRRGRIQAGRCAGWRSRRVSAQTVLVLINIGDLILLYKPRGDTQ